MEYSIGVFEPATVNVGSSQARKSLYTKSSLSAALSSHALTATDRSNGCAGEKPDTAASLIHV